MTFEVGDRVEIIVEGDPLKGCFGEVYEIYPELSHFRSLGILLEDGEELGNPVLWFGTEELRKVEG